MVEIDDLLMLFDRYDKTKSGKITINDFDFIIRN